jgi:hypothetical protein
MRGIPTVLVLLAAVLTVSSGATAGERPANG